MKTPPIIYSILRKADQTYLKRPKDLSSLNKPEELLLIRKLSQFPHVLKVCFSMLDPYPLTAYLSELSGNFHKFYDKHKVLDTSSLDLSRARIRLVKACSTVLRNGLLLLGLSSPEKM
jgi:arginyl-tRNA synthetase